jgi:hypothetical protein
MANPLLELKKYGQSVWYDNLNREMLMSGKLQKMVDEDGVTGGTSNPRSSRGHRRRHGL